MAMAVEHEIGAAGEALQETPAERELVRERERDEIRESLGEGLRWCEEHVVVEQHDAERVRCGLVERVLDLRDHALAERSLSSD